MLHEVTNIKVGDTTKLSSLKREKIISNLKEKEYDLLIIGGGITGAGIALDATTRGLKTALVEKQDFAAGTSSRSTKLIHGGLRYLKQLEFGLVMETGRERSILHNNAPHLVVPEKLILPLFKEGAMGKWATSIGLWVYDLLAGVPKEERRKMLSRERVLNEEPLLSADGLLGGGIYSEYRTDDARLTLEVLKTATKYGADIINYTSSQSFLYRDEKICGSECYDHLLKVKLNIKAKAVVNASGPWVDELRKADNSLNGKMIFLSKGVHLVIPKKRLPIKNSIYFDIPDDNRMMFAIPRGKVTYLGTTDTKYSGNT